MIKIKIRPWHLVLLGLIIYCYGEYHFSLYGVLTTASIGFYILSGSMFINFISEIIKNYLMKNDPEFRKFVEELEEQEKEKDKHDQH